MRSRSTATVLTVIAMAAAGCAGSDATSPDAAPEPTPVAAPADATDAQLAALAAQHKSGDVEASGASGGAVVSGDAVRAAFSRAAGFPLAAEDAGDGYAAFVIATTDDDGNPLPGADRRLARWGSFTLYVGADGRRLADVGGLGDIVPSAAPDRDGIVWTKTTDVVGTTTYTATTFHGGGRIMLAWLGGEQPRLDGTFRRLQQVLRRFDA